MVTDFKRPHLPSRRQCSEQLLPPTPASHARLFRAYYDQAVGGDAEATKICVGIMERMAKINGVIPDRSLVTVDQRSVHVDGGGIGLMELAKMVYEAENREVGNGGDYVKA